MVTPHKHTHVHACIKHASTCVHMHRNANSQTYELHVGLGRYGQQPIQNVFDTIHVYTA